MSLLGTFIVAKLHSMDCGLSTSHTYGVCSLIGKFYMGKQGALAR